MISILIPCYDYFAYPLVSKIEKQALVLNIEYEIICIDDGSFSSKNEANQKINVLTNCKFLESKKNLGRIQNRVLLANSAQYDWLIYVDVDTTPISDNFLEKYINLIGKSALICGGCSFNESTKIENDFLRFEFGKNREEKNSTYRNKFPYKFISSSNFMVKKDIILKVLSKIVNPSYGNDYIFGSILKTKKIKVLHIDNQVSINETESNEIFIAKTHKALENLKRNFIENKIKYHSITILKSYRFIEVFFLKDLFLKITGLFKNTIEKNLESKKPNLFLFDIYRLNYLCKIKDS